MATNPDRLMETTPPLELSDYFRILRERWWVIFYVFATVLAVSAIITFSSPKTYRASTLIAVKRSTGWIFPTAEQGYIPGGTDWMTPDTQRLLVTSNQVLTLALEKLRENDVAVSLEDILDGTKATVEKTGDVIRVDVEHTNPRYAHAIANAVADAFDEVNKKIGSAQAGAERGLIEQEVGKLQISLRGTQERMLRFQQGQGIVNADEEAVQLLEQYADAEKARNELLLKQAEMRASLSETERALAVEDDLILTAVENPFVTALRQQLTAAELQLISAQAKYEPAHPQREKLQTEVEGLRAKLADALREAPTTDQYIPNPDLQPLTTKRLESRAALMAAQSQVLALEQYMAELRRRLSQLPVRQIPLHELQQERDLQQQLYLSMLERQMAASIREGSEQGSAYIIDKGQIPRKPIRPRPERTLPLAMAAGLLLGLGVAFVVELLDSTMRTPEDIEKYTGLAFLGMVPYTGEGERGVIALRRPKSPVTESYRLVRSNLKFNFFKELPKALLVTSAGVKEGKTTTVCNLAVVMAQAGHRVLLVDADLRRPLVHRVFELDNAVGLTNFLVGGQAFESVVQRTSVEGLFVVASGPLPPNPAELLEKEEAAAFIQQAKAFADVVLIDTPPAITVTDAAVLASRLDGVLLVAESRGVTRDAVRQVCQIMERAQATLVGVVLNKFQVNRAGYYYYYYYRYYQAGDDQRSRRRRSSSSSGPQ